MLSPTKLKSKLVFLSVGLLFLNVFSARGQGVYNLKFDSEGKFIGTATEQLNHNKLISTIELETTTFRKQAVGILNDYFTTLDRVIANEKKEGYQKFNISKVEVFEMKRELVRHIQSFINMNKEFIPAYKQYEIRLKRTIDISKYSGGSSEFFPNPQDLLLGNNAYSLEVEFFNEDGVVIRSDKCESSKQVLSYSPCKRNDGQATLVMQSNTIDIPKIANSFTYKLKRNDLKISRLLDQFEGMAGVYQIYRELSDYLPDTNRYQQLLSSLNRHLLQLKAFNPSPDSGVFVNQMTLWANKLGQPAAFSSLLNECYDVSLTRDTKQVLFDSIQSLAIAEKFTRQWVLSWLWLNNGEPTLYPISTYLESKKNTTLVSDSKKARLDTLKAQVQLYDQIFAGDILDLDQIDSAMNEQIKKIAGFKAEIKQIEQSIAKEKPSVTQKYYPFEWLNSGVMAVSSEKLTVYLRHHNALDNFKLMGHYVNEITEIEKMVVLVHNLTSTDKVDISYEIVDAPELSVLEEMFGKSITVEKESGGTNKDKGEGGNKGAGFLEIKDMKECRDSLISLLKAHQEQTERVIKYLVAIKDVYLIKYNKFELSLDETPNYITKEWDHDRPMEFSKLVTYTITKEEGDQKIDMGTGKYRMNKIFRFRPKAGVMYSCLQVSDYTINEDDNSVKVEESGDFGLNATVGMQVYLSPKGYDIRKRGWTYREGCFAYLGLVMEDNPVENWVVGIGNEFISGLGVMTGYHITKTESLNIDGGIPTIDNKWTSTYLPNHLTIVIDVSVFNQFFGLRDYKNPFK